MEIRSLPSPRCRAGLRSALAVAAVAAGLLAGLHSADDAGATVFCVNKPTCVGTPKATIDDALTDAELNGQTDTVHVGAKATPYTDGNGFSYVSNETVHIVGSGRDSTVLEATAFANTLTVLSPTSTVSGMTLKVPDMSNGAGLRWNGTASDVEIEHDGSSQLVNGSVPEGGALLQDSTIDVNGGYAVSGQNVAGAAIRDTSIVSGMSGASWSGTSMSFSRVSIAAPRGAIQVHGSKSSTIDNVLIRSTAGGNPADGAISAANGANVVISHATIAGSGDKRGVIVGADADDASVTVSNSIVTGFQNSLYRLGSGHQANLSIQYSSFSPATVSSGGDGSLTQGAGNLNVTPLFVNPAFGNYRLKAPSPLIDAADPNSATTLDRAGNPRKVDGDGANGSRADMGAYEYQYQAPTAVLTGPDSVGPGVAAAFSAVGSSDPDLEALDATWDFGDGAAAQGFNATHAYAAPGSYTVTLTVTDPAGRTATATKQVQVTAPPAQPGGTGTGGTTGGTTTGGTTGAGPAATLSALRVAPRRIRLGRAAPRLVRGFARGSRIEFVLSKPARVVLRFERGLPGVRSGGRCVAARRGTTGRRCKRYVKAGGTIAVNARAGRSSLLFQGRTSKRRALRPGSHRVTATVAGVRRRTTFTVLPAR